MGVGGNFWDLLKPYARLEGVDFLRDKRVAVDLSFWIVQHDAAIRSKCPRARSPHLRVTFFRTLALFSKFGAFPVFVVDGEPSPLKDRARMERFLRGSGLELPVLLKPPESAAGQAAPAKKHRNRIFTAWVQECVELLEILGMPVLKARSEAEALCAQLNNEDLVDACITSDSDAFLFGAKCVIKCLRSNSKEPFECYYLSDIEAGLGLKRKQMIAMALLVGNDHDLQGVPGFGAETALRFVKLFSDDDVLDRLSEVGKGIIPAFQEAIEASLEHDASSPFEGVATSRSPHCSQCGHPGNKRAHLKIACEYCFYSGSERCIMKSTGFKCYCSGCSKDREIKVQKHQENWQLKVCQKIAAEHGFPNKEIIEMYLKASSLDDEGNCSPLLRWDKPRVENLVDFLSFHQHWDPSYIRQRILPMLSTIFLREMASTPLESLLLYDQYEFHSIERVKIRCGHPYYLVKWKKTVHSLDYAAPNVPNEELESEQTESRKGDESVDAMDGLEAPTVLVDDGCWYLVTEENIELVQAAFPKAVEKFLQEKQPPGFQDTTKPHHVCHLHKAIYGLKQAPRLWYKTFSDHLRLHGFQVSTADPSLLFHHTSTSHTYLIIYVDDILITGNDPTYISHLYTQLKQKFQMKPLTPLTSFLGINITQTPSGILLNQPAYIHDLLHTSGLHNSKPVLTPAALKTPPNHESTTPFHDPTYFRKLTGALQYLIGTRPDIAYAVNILCQHMQGPTVHHFQLLKRVLRYLQATPTHGLPISAGPLTLTAYSDADWAGDTNTRRSTTGYCVFLGPTLISWKVHKQKTVARSSTEAEFRALAAATTEVIWLRRILAEFGHHQNNPTPIFCDNTSAIAIASNPIFHARTKHVEIDFHFVRDHINNQHVQVYHLSTQDQPADIFTKPHPTARFQFLRDKLTVRLPDTEFEGG